jgi:3-vinyl bacteriochlorophyllide hydratase
MASISLAEHSHMEPNAPVELKSSASSGHDGNHSGFAGRPPSGPLWRRSRWVTLFDQWCDVVAPCPWGSSVGQNAWNPPPSAWNDSAIGRLAPIAKATKRAPLYTAEERRRRDASPWTMVQAVLAPLQFVAFGVSLALVLRYLATGEGYGIATASILVKTLVLYAIMITGSIWEKVVFGKWLFARAFFWEDVFSMLVLSLQTAYLVALLMGWGSPRQQMMIAIAAYAAYAINASQFLLKLRAARLEGAGAVHLPGLAA